MSVDSLRWLTTEQIRKQQGCRRKKVLDAMDAGLLPFEPRGRVRYARMVDVEKWEESRLRGTAQSNGKIKIPSDFADLL